MKGPSNLQKLVHSKITFAKIFGKTFIHNVYTVTTGIDWQLNEAVPIGKTDILIGYTYLYEA